MQLVYGQRGDGDYLCGDGVGMGTTCAGTGWGWGQLVRGRMGMGTEVVPMQLSTLNVFHDICSHSRP